MVFYISFHIFIMVLFFLSQKSTKKLRYSLINLILIALFLLAGLRGMVGSDTPAYIRHFHLAAGLSGVDELLLTLEPFYVLLVVLVRYFTDSEMVFLLVYAAIQTYLLSLIYLKLTNKNFFIIYVCLFYLDFHFNVMRAGLACLLFICYLLDERPRLKFLYAIAAPGFHVSILIFYPFYVFRYKYKYLIFLFLFVGLIYINTDLIAKFLEKMSSYQNYLAEDVGGLSISTLLVIPYLVISILYYRIESSNYKKSVFILGGAYLVYLYYPAAYRFVNMAQLVYLLHLFNYVTIGEARRFGWFFAWPLIFLFISIRIYGIYFETENLQKRIDNRQLSDEVLDSTYIPYKFYWTH